MIQAGHWAEASRDGTTLFGGPAYSDSRMGIEPIPKDQPLQSARRFTEHRTVTPTNESPQASSPDTAPMPTEAERATVSERPVTQEGVAVGDKIVLLFGDDQRRLSLRLTEDLHDPEKGALSHSSALGKAIQGAEEGDEIEFDQEDGRKRKALIESVQKGAAISVNSSHQESTLAAEHQL